ncbi:Zinc finger GRF-type [Penicillium lagena]|uniref:Zinc finger GRF-type n=1 Tax=Penicillium lagena TaxID=94218 RepID=UPI00253F7E1C|nr:Zinc finger GRF-type [Penicillium lagena]KAJ5624281.1 Zinc finger GRF-type [Penicillium lagena]
MISPHKKPPDSPRTGRHLDGLFKDGIWCCNCPERPPAIKHQVKKDNENHGRYFYVCAQPQPVRCRFFLWQSDAQVRERAAVLANTRSEPDPFAQTPSRTYRAGAGLLTPQTEHRFVDVPPRRYPSPPKTAKARMMAEDTDEYGWNDDQDDDEELKEALSSSQSATASFISQPNFHPELPSKAARTSEITSPGKRKMSDVADDSPSRAPSTLATPLSSRSSRFPPSSAEVCMTPTPSKYRDVISADSKTNRSDLAKDALAILDKHSVVLPNHALNELVALLDRQELKMKGIIQGRDMSRKALKKKEEQIEMLNERIEHMTVQRGSDSDHIKAMKNP